MVSVRMPADARHISDFRLDVNGLAEKPYLLGSPQKGIAQSARNLESHKENRGLFSPQVML